MAVVICVGAAGAWACTGVTSLSASPTEGPVGTRVMVTGGQFGDGPVEVRWDSATGTLLATAQGPDFTVAVTIPATHPDTHLIYARGSVGDMRVVFTVVPGTAPAPDTSTNRSGSQGTSAGTSTAGVGDDSSTSQTPSGSPVPAQSSASGSGAAFPQAAGAQSAPQSSTASAGASETTAGAVAAPVGPQPAVDGFRAPGSRSAPSAGVSPAPRPGDEGAPLASPAQGEPADSGPSPATGNGDLWSGFEPGTSTARGASLTESTGDSPGLPTQAGAVALAAGVVAVFGGFAAAELRRARAKARVTG